MVEGDEVVDHNYAAEPDLKRVAKTQALILKHFWKTSLRKFHKTTGSDQVKNTEPIRWHAFDLATCIWLRVKPKCLRGGSDYNPP